MTTVTAPVGRAVARRVDSSGLPAVYDVLRVTGCLGTRRVLLRYVGHLGPGGACVRDPDAQPVNPWSTAAVWSTEKRFHVHLYESHNVTVP